jgi:hypothetical protein
MPKITGLLIDVNTGKASAKTIDRNLESYYKILDCDMIDIVSRNIGARRFNIICDDEALLKSPCNPSAYDMYYEYCLFGNLFVTGEADEEGNLTSLSKKDFNYLKHHLIEGFASVPSKIGCGLMDTITTRILCHVTV